LCSWGLVWVTTRRAWRLGCRSPLQDRSEVHLWQ
jgi:hypothetical protein